MLPNQVKIMKLTSMKSFVFPSGLKHTHRSDVRGPSPANHFLVSTVALKTGTGETVQGQHSIVGTMLPVALENSFELRVHILLS